MISVTQLIMYFDNKPEWIHEYNNKYEGIPVIMDNFKYQPLLSAAIF